MNTSIVKRRRPWLAALLSLLGGPLGQVYTGHFRRSVFLWSVGAFLAPIFALSCITLPVGRVGLFFFLLCMLAFSVFLAADAFLLARRDRNVTLKSYQRWWVYILLFFVFVAANNAVGHIVKTFIAEAFVIPGRAMSPTIHDGDRILVDMLRSDSKRLRRNDVAVFRSDGPDSPLFVMRVVGLPGDQIEIKNERLFVNGTEWDDQHAVFEGPLPMYIDIANYGPITIPDDSFFVLGDNRRLASDSRLRGPIPLSDFYGIARMIYWSRVHTFPDPRDTSYRTPTPSRWDRIGRRLD